MEMQQAARLFAGRCPTSESACPHSEYGISDRNARSPNMIIQNVHRSEQILIELVRAIKGVVRNEVGRTRLETPRDRGGYLCRIHKALTMSATGLRILHSIPRGKVLLL